jgi:hypothetical protein
MKERSKLFILPPTRVSRLAKCPLTSSKLAARQMLGTRPIMTAVGSDMAADRVGNLLNENGAPLSASSSANVPRI